jgi:hypothetical protein
MKEDLVKRLKSALAEYEANKDSEDLPRSLTQGLCYYFYCQIPNHQELIENKNYKLIQEPFDFVAQKVAIAQPDSIQAHIASVKAYDKWYPGGKPGIKDRIKILKNAIDYYSK